ncbi:30S ribosomal protein S19 [Symbiodinium microadriaticum]|uniref:Small ribosomal subunit protein uS19c n=1 Tax=Symbiodinium microadriaticum TaxID=2951 RepID=A0A1Q9C0F2_SYMMI|nr:30S ribosomal protein S19 [Symbiodinium microadriaticum]
MNGSVIVRKVKTVTPFLLGDGIFVSLPDLRAGSFTRFSLARAESGFRKLWFPDPPGPAGAMEGQAKPRSRKDWAVYPAFLLAVVFSVWSFRCLRSDASVFVSPVAPTGGNVGGLWQPARPNLVQRQADPNQWTMLRDISKKQMPRKPPFIAINLLNKITRMNKEGKKETVRAFSRQSTIIPAMIGHTCAVHNGREFVPIVINEGMVGFKLGDFVPTHTFTSHPKQVMAGSVAKDEWQRDGSQPAACKKVAEKGRAELMLLARDSKYKELQKDALHKHLQRDFYGTTIKDIFPEGVAKSGSSNKVEEVYAAVPEDGQTTEMTDDEEDVYEDALDVFQAYKEVRKQMQRRPRNKAEVQELVDCESAGTPDDRNGDLLRSVMVSFKEKRMAIEMLLLKEDMAKCNAALTSGSQQGQVPDFPCEAYGDPHPKRIIQGRVPANCISDADWSAMASGEAFITSAPETVAPGSSFISHCAIDDTESIASGSTTMPNLNLLAGAWAEFNMRGVSDREVRARQTTDFFEQLRTAGYLIDFTLAREVDHWGGDTFGGAEAKVTKYRGR